jgi:Na+-driven multidrug efflux pump
MDVLVGFLRGVGYSTIPMVVSLIGVCAFRVGWIYTVFESYKTLSSLYISYPISWTITVFALVSCILVFYPKIKKKMHLNEFVRKA